MTVDALFPARGVVEPFFGERIYPSPTNAGWAFGRAVELESLALADPVLQIMALAGWRAVRVNYTYLSGQTLPGLQWVSTNLHTRIAELSTLESAHSAFAADLSIDGSACLWIDFEQQTDGGSSESHAYSDIPAFFTDAYWSDAAYHEWDVEFSSTGTLRLYFVTRPPGGIPADAVAAQPHFNARLAELAIQVTNFATACAEALDAAVAGVVAGAGGAAQVNTMDLPGLLWLFDPETWTNPANTYFDSDLFVASVRAAAVDVWEHMISAEALGGIMSHRFWSLERYHEKARVEARNYRDIADKAEIYGPEIFPEYGPALPTPAEAPVPDGPFKGMAAGCAYFDLICAMIHTQRIMPPALGTLGLTGNFDEGLTEIDEEEGPILAAFGHMNEGDPGSEEYCALYVYGVFALQLIQARHPRDAAYTPDLRERVAWEYKGVQPDGAHLVALTLGRGVRIVEPAHGLSLRIDVFRAQSDSDFRRPLSRPAHLDPVAVPVWDTDAFYVDPEQGEDYSLPQPMMTDDLSATAAQALDHQILRSVMVFQAHVPATLSNIPFTVPNVPPVLANFSPDSPPVLAVRRLDRGGIRFEWYRDGLLRPAPAVPELTYALTLRPNVPEDFDASDRNTMETDASFGVSWFLDYGCLMHKPLTEDALASFVAAQVKDRVAEMIWARTLGLSGWLGAGTWLEGDNALDELGDWVKPHGIGFLRVWYSGDDVRVEVERYSDSDEDFRVEIVKVDHVLDLPEQGERLPARSIYMGDYVTVGDPGTDSSHTGLFSYIPCYDFMMDPEASDIPLWRDTTMPPQLQLPGGGYHADALSHVNVLESHAENFIAGWMGGVVSYSDSRYFVINDDDWDSWEDWFGDNDWPNPDHRIPGTMRTTATTDWMIFTILCDVAVGVVPYLGTSVDVAEFLYALETGEDKWGQPVATWQLALMGIAASVPFVSGSALKGVTASTRHLALGNSFLGSVLPDAMRGLDLTALQKLVGLWEPAGKTLTDKQATDAVTQVIEAGLRASHDTATRLDPAAIVKSLSEMTIEVIKDAGAAGGAIAARQISETDCSFILFLANGAEVRIVVPALDEAWKAARKTKPDLTFKAFIQSQKYASGMNRAIADAFGLIRYERTITNTGVPRGGGVWTLMGDLALDAPHRLAPTQMLTRLRGDDVVSNTRSALAATPELAQKNATAIAYLDKYGADVQRLLTDLEAEGMLAKLIGTKEFSDDYVIVGLARVLEHFDASLLKAGHGMRLTDLLSGADTATMTATELAQRKTLLEGIADFGGRALRQVKYPWAYELELDGAVFLSKKVQSGILEFSMQVTYAGRQGADGAGFVADGFNVVECKSLAKAVQQVGAEGVQPNLLQAMKSVHRMTEVLATGATGPLDDAIVPAFSTNKFLRRFFFVADRTHLARSGQMSLAALYELAGGVVSIPWSRIPVAMQDEVLALGRRVGAGTVSDAVDIIDVGHWYKAAQMLDTDALDVIFKQAMVAQADDIRDMLLALNKRADLQALLDGQGTLGPRTSANLAAFVNSRKSWPGLPVHSQNLPADYFLGTQFANGGAARFLEILGVADDWLVPVLKSDPGNANEMLDVAVSIVSRSELDDLTVNAFSALPARIP